MSKELIKFLDQIDKNQLIEFAKRDSLKEALNVSPPPSWIKNHPFAKDVRYLPIDKVESLLDSIFQEWQVEIKSVSQLAQSILAIVRLHYRDPINKEWRFHDGVGACALKTDKGFTAADLAHIKSSAVETGAPAAVSYAIKDAADHLGAIFGKNLNRKDTAGTTSIYASAVADYERNTDEAAKELAQKRIKVMNLIAKAESLDTKTAYKRASEMALDELDKVINAAIQEGDNECREQKREASKQEKPTSKNMGQTSTAG